MSRLRMISALLALTVGSLVLPAPPAGATTTTTTLTATADTYVSSKYPAAKYGTKTKLQIDGAPTARALLRFDAGAVKGAVTRATLRLYVNRSNTPFSVHPLHNTMWEEKTVTYADAPSFGAAVATSGPVSSGTWVSIDVTPLVNAGGSVDLALTTADRRLQTVASRESTTKPSLVVESGPAADVAPPAVSISDPPTGTVYTREQTVAIAAAVSDDVGVSKVEMYDNGVLAGTEDTSPFVYSWAVSAAANGSHTWTAKAYDAAGNTTTSSPVSLTVDIDAPTPTTTPSVAATVETEPVPHAGDAADDIAIWPHPGDTGLSTIIGTDKLGGLAVYDLSGRQLHYYADSSPNNVDLRGDFLLAGERVSIVATSSTGDDSIRVYRVDPVTRGLEYVAARTLSVGIGISGLCMYRSPATGKFYVFDSDSSGTVQQWELYDNGAGRVDARKVRTLTLGSTTEGCVVDDELGHLYVAEEDVAIWKYGADAEDGAARTQVDVTGASGRLTADIEGLAIYDAGAGNGYLVASSQGSNSYAVYERNGANAFVTSFGVVAGTVDGVSYTDGIDVTSLALGTQFPEGVFVAQDDRNDTGNQNFKLIPWGSVARSVNPPLAVKGRTGNPPAPTEATTYYLDSVDGNDASTGTSPADPWRTLNRLNDATLEPGDRAQLKRGRVWQGSVKISASGATGSPIVVGAYGAGAPPRVEGASTCIDLVGSDIHVADVHVDGCKWAGVGVSGSNTRVERSLVTNNVVGIYVRSSAVDTAIVGNELRDNNRMSVLTSTPTNDDSGAMGILIHGDRTEVAFNVISGSDAFSYDYGRDGAAIEIFGGRQNHIHHNMAQDNDVFSELGNPRSADNTYAYNAVRSSLATSAFVVTRGAASRYGPVLRTTLVNNTVLMTGEKSQGFVCHAGCSPEILEMRNNVIKARWKVGYADAAFNEADGLYDGGLVQFPMGPGSVKANPVFVNEATGDLRLQSTSPGIDSGSSHSYVEDLDRGRVPADGNGDGLATTDRGAYEYRR